MTDVISKSRPAWQSEELAEEWIEDAVEQEDGGNVTSGTRSLSLTIPLSSAIRTNSSDLSIFNRSQPTGTFLVRQDLPATPLMRKTRGGRREKMGDFFSPLPLERMFEPPSPPRNVSHSPKRLRISSPNLFRSRQVDSRKNERQNNMLDKSDSGGPAPMYTMVDGRKEKLDCPFTFTVPRQTAEGCNGTNGGISNQPPLTDPRLRLFRFQYDTFTREHLSAIVDSIAINTPSGPSTTEPSGNHSNALSRVSEITPTTPSRLRSAKRVKLSLPSDLYDDEGDGAGAAISRPKHARKDYVEESQSLMQKIKQARDFSTVSTAGASSPASWSNLPKGHDQAMPKYAGVDQPLFPIRSQSIPLVNTSSTKLSPLSPSSYRMQAAALMAQIKNDMKGSKRIYSGESEVSRITHVDDRSLSISPSPDSLCSPASSDDKGNNHSHSQRSFSNASDHLSKFGPRLRASPRKLLRRLSAADEVDRELAEVVSNITVEDNLNSHVPIIQIDSEPTLPLAPPSNLQPSYPSSSARTASGEDFNRLVSSSTVSGTTLTAGSVPSFMKHSGAVQIHHILPNDVPVLPERVGKMIFDKVMMKWVKSTAMVSAGIIEEDSRERGTEETSNDPFRDIHSLTGERSHGRMVASEEGIADSDEQSLNTGIGRIKEVEDVVDEEEAELNSFSFDAAFPVVENGPSNMRMDGSDGDITTDSEDDIGVNELSLMMPGPDQCDNFDSEDESEPEPGPSTIRLFPSIVPQHTVDISTPSHTQRDRKVATPVIRSVLKSTSATPASVLKDGSRSRHKTPPNKTDRRRHRSVSFSDGKRDGPIRGLGRNARKHDDYARSESDRFVPSVRSKRIAHMMNDLEDSSFNDIESPTKTSSSGRPEELTILAPRSAPTSGNATAGDSWGNSSQQTSSRSQSSMHHQGHADADRTFLTECSFGVAYDRLVQVITDVQPIEPHWSSLTSINLVSKNIESVARLKELLPCLETLQLGYNQLSWLSGIPGTVRTLSVPSNNLSSITSFGHLLNLQHLDISGNNIDSISQLACLRHLKELRADANKISIVDGLQEMDLLQKLSLQRNCIRSIELSQYRWPRMEVLNLRQNQLDSISGLASLSSLIALNIDDNSIGGLNAGGAMPRLRIIRTSRNRLQSLDLGCFPNIRTLYADNNALRSVVKLDKLTKLENLSLRNQVGHGLACLTRDIRDAKRLYLSGNPLRSGFLNEACFNLHYLELAACRLTSLPDRLALLAPNLRVLNLNYNFLEDIRPLEGLTRLRKLTIIGSRIKSVKPLIHILQRMPDVEMLDCRMNPCTLGWYLPLLIGDVPGALQPSEGGGIARGEKRDYGWQELDSKFRRGLPDEAYLGRLAYRGLVMRACEQIRMLDGVEVSSKERAKAEELLVAWYGNAVGRG